MYRFGTQYSFFILLSMVLVLLVFWGGIENLWFRWINDENYSHGLLLPLVAVYFIWQKRFEIAAQPFTPSWFSLFIAIIAFVFLVIGEITALYIVIHFALLVIILACVLAITGWSPLKFFIAPLIILALSIPLPFFLEASLSAELQLLSSKIGVAALQLFNIPVFLEGNIIDLGSYKLQVVDACSGLRYLFPLLSFGFIAAYLFNVEWWKRLLVLLSTIPITILMNSFRIAVTGVLVNHFGTEMAENFIHDFEGWIIFVACLIILLLEMKLLTRVGQKSEALFDVFMQEPLEKTDSVQGSQQLKERQLSQPLMVLVFMLFAMLLIINITMQRDETIPDRKELVLFPLNISSWQGQQGQLTADTIKKLKLSDYLKANYQLVLDYKNNNKNAVVNFYVAYYESQRKGASPHSPRVCVPGGGWEITRISREKISDYLVAEGTLNYNRVVIQKGEQKQLVYYWFQQRGRLIANEYLMKWYLLKDALQKNRTDGALIRLVTFVNPNEEIKAADERLKQFINDVGQILPEYVPD